MTVKFFINPFGVGGDLAAIPDSADPSGNVSYQTGFGYDYERDPTPGVDPLAKNIPRTQSNQLYYDITSVLQQYQTHGVPDYITVTQNGGIAYPYDVYAKVRYDDGTGVAVYTSLVTNNTALPSVTANWRKGDASVTGLSGDVTGSGTGVIATTIANNAVTTVKIAAQAVTLNKIAAIPAYSVMVNATNAAASPGTVALGNKQLLGRGDLTAGSLGAISLDSTLSILGNTLGAAPPPSLLSQNGWQQIFGGVLIQWGVIQNVPLDQTFNPVVFPKPFLNQVFNIQATIARTYVISGTVATLVDPSSITLNGFNVAGDQDTHASSGNIFWMAIGY